MSEVSESTAARTRPHPSELRKLLVAERSAVLEAQASLVEQAYRHDRELTASEAFGEEDLNGDAGTTEAR